MMKYILISLLISMVSTVQADKELPVSLAEVKKFSEQQLSWINATVISRQNINISAESTGRIIWIAEFGEQLSKGDLLARIDDQSLQLKLKYQQQVLRKAKENSQYRSQELKRLEVMKKVQGISQTQLDLARHDFQIAKIELKEQRITLETIQNDISKSQIYAPFNGVIEIQHLQSGEYAEKGQSLLTLVNNTAPEIKLYAPIALVNMLTSSQTLQLRGNEQKGLAKLVARSYQADEKSRQLELRLKPDNPVLWQIGQALQVALPKNVNKSTLAIPRDALVVDQKGKAVFKVGKSNAVKRIPVRVISGNAETVAILGELKAGDQVVVRGSGMLKTGDIVKPI